MKKRLNAMKLSRLKKQRAKPQPLTNEQIRALLNAANAEWKTMILVSLHTGQRLHDVARLTWDAVDLKHATIHFRSTKARLQTVLIGPELLAHLKTLARPAETQAPLFKMCCKASMENPAKLLAQFRQLQRERELKPVSFHCLRLTFLLRRKSVPFPLACARALVGQVDPTYSAVDLAALKQELSRLAEIP